MVALHGQLKDVFAWSSFQCLYIFSLLKEINGEEIVLIINELNV